MPSESGGSTPLVEVVPERLRTDLPQLELTGADLLAVSLEVAQDPAGRGLVPDTEPELDPRLQAVPRVVLPDRVNRALGAVTSAKRRLIRRGVSFPLGGSLLVVAKRR
jgi:hypothetical protein